jgi:hypothetical protein
LRLYNIHTHVKIKEKNTPGPLSNQQISEVEKNRSRRLYISVQKPPVERGWDALLPHPHLFPSRTVDILVKDDLTVILLPLSFVASSPYDSL